MHRPKGKRDHVIRVISWNAKLGANGRPKLERICDLDPDLVLLQEVLPGGCALLRESASFPLVFDSHALRPRRPDEEGDRDLHCAILAGDRFRLRSRPRLLDAAPAPERTLTLSFESDFGPVAAASFHFVAGSDAWKKPLEPGGPRRPKWGREKKAQNFRAVANWLKRHPRRTIVGIDCNSPEVDHPDVARNVYWDEHIQLEYLLHDPRRAPHCLEDGFRVYLRDHPRELARIRNERPTGPLALSHINKGNDRRYDFIFVTPDLCPTGVDYLYDEARAVKADHALVVADIVV